MISTTTTVPHLRARRHTQEVLHGRVRRPVHGDSLLEQCRLAGSGLFRTRVANWHEVGRRLQHCCVFAGERVAQRHVSPTVCASASATPLGPSEPPHAHEYSCSGDAPSPEPHSYHVNPNTITERVVACRTHALSSAGTRHGTLRAVPSSSTTSSEPLPAPCAAQQSRP
jgi:hypothetical protein